MLKCEGIAEQPLGSNRGDSVTKWIKYFGINYPVPWCGAFTGVKSIEGMAVPSFGSLRALSYAVKDYRYQLSDVIYGNYIPKPGDWRVKIRDGGGHVDTFIEWDTLNQKGYVIGGNVGDKVTVREVTLQSMITDRTQYIVDVQGFYGYYFYQKPAPDTLTRYKAQVSVYHSGLTGRKTANGEYYNPNKLTIAHLSLPFGTRVKFINAKTGQTAEAVVNDRGPYSKKYEFDLSTAVYKKLGKPCEVVYQIIESKK